MVDTNPLLHIRNFWAHHLTNDGDLPTYFSMACKLGDMGLGPEHWDKYV